MLQLACNVTAAGSSGSRLLASHLFAFLSPGLGLLKGCNASSSSCRRRCCCCPAAAVVAAAYHMHASCLAWVPCLQHGLIGRQPQPPVHPATCLSARYPELYPLHASRPALVPASAGEELPGGVSEASKAAELKAALKEWGLPISGTKPELWQRLLDQVRSSWRLWVLGCGC